jgi:hypothetical protein
MLEKCKRRKCCWVTINNKFVFREPAADNFQGPDLAISNTGSFKDLMQIEWGPDLGKGLCLRLPYFHILDGWAYVVPSGEDDAVEIIITLDKKAAGRLREDKEWTSFAKEYE